MTRQRLPDRREAHSIELTHIWDPQTDREFHERLRINFSSLPNGQSIGEVVYEPDNARGTKTVNTNHDVCILISLALQWGVPLQEMRDAVLHHRVNRLGVSQMVAVTQIGAILDTLARGQGLPEVELIDNPLDSPVNQ